MADDDEINLLSQDGTQHRVLVKYAKMSGTLKDLIDDVGVENDAPLPNISSKNLSYVIEYWKKHVDDVKGNEEDEEDKKIKTEWDLQFTQKWDRKTLFKMILASNYLDVKPLLDLTCETVANMIKGKTPDEIKKAFGITDDFTSEEEKQVREENEWCKERSESN